MQKVKLVIAIILVYLFATQVVVYAAPNSSISTSQNEKREIALIVVDDEAFWVKEKVIQGLGANEKQIEELWVKPISQTLGNRYSISADQKYYEKFKAAGYFTVIDAERNDIIEILKDDDLNFVILIEVLDVDRDMYSTTYNMQMKIVDIKADKNIYNGKFKRNGKIAPLAEQMVTVINEKLM